MTPPSLIASLSLAVTLVDGSTHITHDGELKVMRWKP